MVPGIYMASDAMTVRTRELEVIANNIANVNTSGYKRDAITFESLLEEQLFTEKSLSRWSSIIYRAAREYNLEPELIESMIVVESGGNPDAVSSKGAKGLMQIMDPVARRLGIKDVFDPEENIFGGACYLRELLDEFGGNKRLALAAYNAGPTVVKSYRGIPPYSETQNYVKKVLYAQKQAFALHNSGQAFALHNGGILPIEYIDFSEGEIELTDAVLDFALRGKGFFTVQTPYGERYTRSGNFRLTSDGILSTHQGYPVLGSLGEILITGSPGSGKNISLSSEGEIIVDGEIIDEFLIRDFEKVEKQGENLFKAVGEEREVTGTHVLQGALEKSNVFGVKELVKLTDIQKSYERCEKLISVQSETIGMVVNQVGRLR